MAKIIKYKFLSCEVNHGTEENPVMEQILLKKSMPWNEANEELAKQEAYNGEYTIADDDAVVSVEPTQLDRMEAQIVYTAMMTDTLLEV